jgi:RHS repeat-associated protein
VGLGTTLEKYDTYYIYDVYGNLTFVLPPKMDATFATITTINSQLNDLAYQYKYDYRNRLVEKKLPGKQWEFIVYDKLDRPVATGPANSPFNDTAQGAVGWLITKYDIFSRPVYTGWEQVTSINTTARITKQNNENSKTVFNETKQTSGIIDGIAAFYSNLVAPTSFKLLTVNYYDNYTFPSAAPIPTAVETEPVLTTAQVKSLATGSWTRILAAAGATNGETATTFYDAKARPIRTYTTNFLGGYTYTDTKLDFVGVPQYSITYHKRSSGATELKTKEAFTYSAQGRLLTQTHQINDGAIELIASNNYDELGQLIIKNVGNTVSLPLQKVNFAYNIRGWMTEINKTASLTQTADPKDLFAFKINYNTIATGISGVKPLYNGNIAETYWNTADLTRAYGYKYDNLNRLKDAIYQRATATTNAYNESLTYDKNGNITTLLRNGSSDLTTTSIDNLVYTYGSTNTNNQLMKVTDSSNKTVGFKDGSNSGEDYTYDTNGNMKTDLNKNITAITYNHLNLPTKITFGTAGNIVYIYDATGQKNQKIVNDNGNVTTTDYLNGYQYLNTVLQFFPTAEGYVEPVAPSSYKYVYQYKDHLGNVRLSYRNTGSTTAPSLQIQEENNYYPFGLKQTGYGAPSISSNNKYKYNGKELQDELGLNWYDYQARNYDPALGRWFNIDPLAETSRRFSPYTYCLNNPIYYIDPDGMQADDFTILIAKEGAGGKGHMAAVIEDGKGNYYYATMGAAENAGLSKMASKGVQGGMVLQKLEGAKSMDEAIKLAKTDTNNSPYTDQVTFETNSRTDMAIFDEMTKKTDAVNSGEDKYNLISNNCTDAVEQPIEEATSSTLSSKVEPNSNFDEVKANKSTIQSNITKSENKLEKKINSKLKDERDAAITVKDNIR